MGCWCAARWRISKLSRCTAPNKLLMFTKFALIVTRKEDSSGCWQVVQNVSVMPGRTKPQNSLVEDQGNSCLRGISVPHARHTHLPLQLGEISIFSIQCESGCRKDWLFFVLQRSSSGDSSVITRAVKYKCVGHLI